MRLALLGILAGLAAAASEAPPNVPDTDLPTFSTTFETGWTFQSQDGSDARMGQYVRPQNLPWLSIWDLDLRLPSEFDLLDVYARRFGSENSDGFFSFWTPGIPTMLRAGYHHATFYPEPTAAVPQGGSRSGASYEMRIYPTPGLTMGFSYATEGVVLPGLVRSGRIDYDLEDVRADINVPLGEGDLSFDLGALTYRDRFAGRPGSTTHQYGLRYSIAPGTRWFFGADLRWAAINQPGLPSSDLFVMGFSGRYQPARNLRIDSRWRYRDADYGPTQTVYVAQSLSGNASVAWRPVAPVTVKLGVERASYDRLDAVQAATDRIGETRVTLRGDYRGPSSLRASATYRYRHLDSIAASAAPLIGDASTLQADTEHQVALRASAAVGQGGLAYGLYQWRERSWDDRSIVQQTNQLGLGVSYPVAANLNLAGDLYMATFATNLLSLSGLEADSLVLHGGLVWSPAAWCHLACDYHRVEGYHGENTGQDFVSAGLDVDLGRDLQLRFGYRREDFTSALAPGLIYDTDILNISLVSRL